MQITKVSYAQGIYNNGKAVKTNRKLTSTPIQNSTINPNEIFKSYSGRDMVSFGLSDFNKTLKDNYFRLPKDCQPDAFQVQAGRALHAGKDVLVEAPTGTGKTAIAHYAVANNMEQGKTTFYTTPLKALSNQKLKEFRAVYGDENVGILTGDRRENVDAPVIIMTTEVYRNMALSGMNGAKNPLMENLGTVIFDEFHYLDDDSRGPVWEESVMFTPQNVQVLGLSATIGNPIELKHWLGSLKEDDNVELISMPPESRAVPLTFNTLSTRAYEKLEKKIAKAIKRGETPNFEENVTVKKPKLTDFKQAVEKLNAEKQLPAIFFIFSRNYSRETLEYLGKEGQDLTTPAEKEQIQKILDKYSSEKYIGADLNVDALKKGYAIHNAGIIPGQKELIEELFQKKLLKVVIATETLAAGINMPAKTVVISSPYKPCDSSTEVGKLLDADAIKYEEEDESDESTSSEEKEKTPVRMLTSNEFKQMSGRAGRRGIDTVGFVYTMPTSRASEQDFLYLEVMDSNSINSKYNPDYPFLSEYYEYNSDDSKLSGIYDKSFYAYDDDETRKEAKIDELMEISSRKTNILLDRGFLVGENGSVEPTVLANMAAKVKGYDALTLAEAISSKAFDCITPQALAMVAASIALPANSNDSAIGQDTDFSNTFEKTQQGVKDVRQKLVNSINSMLIKLGKTMESFGSYDQLIDFVEHIEKPQAPEYEIVALMQELEARRAKMYKITKTTGNYSVDEVVQSLLNGEVVPTKALESHLASVQTYKKKINARSIDDHVRKLKAELQGLDTSQKGNKAKARLERKQRDIEASIKMAMNMQFLDENIPEALASNHKFIKKNPPVQVKQDYRDVELQFLKLTTKDVLLTRIKALQALEESIPTDEEFSIVDFDSRIVKEAFKTLLQKSAEIYASERKNGITAEVTRFNKDTALSAYAWATLNQLNPCDSMTNWAQLIKMAGDEVDEGTLYRNIMQTVDLLSQMAEMATVGEEKSETEEDKEYYSNLKETASEARKLLLHKPTEI